MPEHTPDQTPQEIADEALKDSPSRRQAFEQPKGIKRFLGGRKRQEAAGDALAADIAEAHLANDMIDAKQSEAATQRHFDELQGDVETMVQTAEEHGRAAAKQEQREAEQAQEAAEAKERDREVTALEGILNQAVVDAIAKGEAVEDGGDTKSQMVGETENLGSGPNYPEDISLIRRKISGGEAYVVQVTRQEDDRRKPYRFPKMSELPENAADMAETAVRRVQRDREKRYAGLPLVVEDDTYVLDARSNQLTKYENVVVDASEEELERLEESGLTTRFRVTVEDVPAHEVRDLSKLVGRAERVPIEQG